MPQWFEYEEGFNRLMGEKELMFREYSYFIFDIDKDGYAYCEGIIGPNESLRRSYFIRCRYSYNYGYGEPIKVTVPSEIFPPNTPHLYEDKSLCYEHGDFRHDADILDAMAWVIKWLVLYEEFLETGKIW